MLGVCTSRRHESELRILFNSTTHLYWSIYHRMHNWVRLYSAQSKVCVNVITLFILQFCLSDLFVFVENEDALD